MQRREVLEKVLDLLEEAKVRKIASPSEVARLIQNLCAQESATFADYMLRKAWIESRYNPLALNRSSYAAGLYQLMWFNIEKEWEENPDFDPFNPGHNILWTIHFTEDNAERLTKNGFDITPGRLYLAHQQGGGGALQILRGAQRGLSISQLDARIQQNVRANIPRGVNIATCAEFVNLWEQRMRNASIPNTSLATNDIQDEDSDYDENELV